MTAGGGYEISTLIIFHFCISLFSVLVALAAGVPGVSISEQLLVPFH